MATSIDGVTGYGKLATNKAYAMSAIPFCYNGNELPRLSLVRVFEVLHFLVCYYFCWIIRAPHNCLKYSYKGTNFLVDLKIKVLIINELCAKYINNMTEILRVKKLVSRTALMEWKSYQVIF